MKLIKILKKGIPLDKLIIKQKSDSPLVWIFHNSISNNKNKIQQIEIETRIRHHWYSNATDNGEGTETDIVFFFDQHRLSFQYTFEGECRADPKSHRSCTWTWEPDYLKIKKLENPLDDEQAFNDAASFYKTWKGRWRKSSFRKLKGEIELEYIDCLKLIVKRLRFPMHPNDRQEAVVRFKKFSDKEYEQHLKKMNQDLREQPKRVKEWKKKKQRKD